MCFGLSKKDKNRACKNPTTSKTFLLRDKLADLSKLWCRDRRSPGWKAGSNSNELIRHELLAGMDRLLTDKSAPGQRRKQARLQGWIRLTGHTRERNCSFAGFFFKCAES
jgi:hypothetical protein